MTRIGGFLTRVACCFILILVVFFGGGGDVFALTDEECLDCHGDKDFITEKDGETISLFIDMAMFGKTVHAENGCTSCHADAADGVDEHPVPLASVNCADCHDRVGEAYQNSDHGKAALDRDDELAPTCKDCHTKHNILPPTDKESSTYPLNIPFTCGRCHREGTEMTKTHDLNQHNVMKNYSMSIHGKGLFVDGLIVTAVCSTCHTAHNVLKASNPESSVNRNNIIETCNQCHVGIVDMFKTSVHSETVTRTGKRLPVCHDCHTSHTIADVKKKDFRLIIAEQCNNCHAHESETYLETYHGRASMLWGGEKTAKCSDCHGSHNIQPEEHQASMINDANIVETCSQCHAAANQSFTTYLPHATHSKKDKDRYPYLYYTFWAMTGLLVGTFAFFGLHTILWIPRGLIEKFKGSTGNKTE
ncbi:MAG: cytochrome c3 family protein [Desulfurivibrionaceae bacterium]|nr:cytochrome c3 family protein [Desulfurivibrionaceae bacterium]